ncbi:MAG TPA: TlpA disulfide reductase family protein [Candidatus Acidoferrum sp.]|nr:TlpA disulfide reductase family protein [Candidatus Acidoferrum sp.]
MTNVNVGQAAPEFSLRGLDGQTYSLQELREKGPVVAAFFKISCPVCQFTFPFLQRLYQRYGDEGVTFLGVSQDDAKATTGFAREYGATFPMVLDEKEKGYPASNAYGLISVPTIFLIDPDGTVRVSCMGFVKNDLERIAGELAERRKMAPSPLFRANESVPANKPG